MISRLARLAIHEIISISGCGSNGDEIYFEALDALWRGKRVCTIKCFIYLELFAGQRKLPSIALNVHVYE